MAGGRTRAEQKQHTRALIVSAGREAVATRGFAGLVVREIARDAGIVPTAFYRHFDTLDELATELATGAADAVSDLVDSVVADPTDQPAEHWPRLAVAAGRDRPQTWSVLSRGLVDTGHPDHRILAGAVESARRRLGIALGRAEGLSGADGTMVDTAADLVVVDLIRLLVEASAGGDPRTGAEECTRRLRVILAGAAGA